MRIDAPQYFAPLAEGRTAKRNLLGEYRDRWGFDQLDFDGDGKRDLAVWQPPGTPGAPMPGVGRFRVLTSSSGYTALLERDFGRLGDVPVPGYYDNDTKVDFAVLRRGGLTTENPFDSQLWWLWCKSAQNHDCTGYGQLDWGFQYDVPLPNVEFDGNASTREVAVYRPTDKLIRWRVLGATDRLGLASRQRRGLARRPQAPSPPLQSPRPNPARAREGGRLFPAALELPNQLGPFLGGPTVTHAHGA